MERGQGESRMELKGCEARWAWEGVPASRMELKGCEAFVCGVYRWISAHPLHPKGIRKAQPSVTQIVYSHIQTESNLGGPSYSNPQATCRNAESNS